MTSPRKQGLIFAQGWGLLTFLGTLFLSLYFLDQLSWEGVAWSFFKALSGWIIAFLFFYLVGDTLVKGLRIAVRDEHDLRKEGGFLYHFIEPGENELPPHSTAQESKASRKKK